MMNETHDATQHRTSIFHDLRERRFEETQVGIWSQTLRLLALGSDFSMCGEVLGSCKGDCTEAGMAAVIQRRNHRPDYKEHKAERYPEVIC